MNSVLLKVGLAIPSVLAPQPGWASQALTLGSLYPRCMHVLEGTRAGAQHSGGREQRRAASLSAIFSG